MFKTIFSKMIVIFISILLTAFLIIGIMLNLFLDYFVTDEKASSLEKSGEIVSHSFEIFIENYDDLISRLITRNLFENSLKLYSNYTNSYIWIVTQDGYIWFSEPLIPEEIKNKLMDIQGNVKLPDERQYKKVMSGQYSVVREIGDFYGFFNNRIFHEIGGKWLTVQKPFRYKPSYSNEEFVGAVYLHTPVPEIQKARVAVFKFFIISVIVAAIVSVMLVYLFSQRITRPLRQINEVAKIITQGNFGERLNIESQDEIGELAISFNQMATSLENLEEMRKGFIANVSHELRTPMTSIRGFIEGILDGTIPQEKHQYYLNIVAQETDRLNRLINDLLDLAKMEAGEKQLTFNIFNINELIRVSIIKLERIITEKKIEIVANFEKESMTVKADPDAIERVLQNLLHNAIKFTPEEGVIVVSTWKDKDKVCISVEDSGIGIDESEIDLVWERFHKSDRSRSQDKTGTGLGLAIIKNIVNDHGQKIWVESQPNSGAKFTFTLEEA